MSKVLLCIKKQEKLENVIGGISNNLNFIRFIAAVCVIFSHSYILTSGIYSREGIYMITNNQMTGGSVAVSLFFFVGGFLITKSLSRVSSGKKYFSTRFIRIIPLLLVV